MSLGNPSLGLNNSGVYLMSGDPWLTSSIATATPQYVDFTMFCKSFTLHNTGSNNAIRVGFTSNGLSKSNHYFKLGNNDSYSGDLRVPGIWVMSEGGSAPYELIASLTVVKEVDGWVITGSTQAETGNVRHKGLPGVG